MSDQQRRGFLRQLLSKLLRGAGSALAISALLGKGSARAEQEPASETAGQSELPPDERADRLAAENSNENGGGSTDIGFRRGGFRRGGLGGGGFANGGFRRGGLGGGGFRRGGFRRL